MPIVIPSRAELAHMSWRQRSQLTRNLPALLADVADVCRELQGINHSPVVKLPRREEPPFDPAQVRADAALLLAQYGYDPDAEQHLADIDTRYRARETA